MAYFSNTDNDGVLSQSNLGMLRAHGISPAYVRPGLKWLTEQGILLRTEETEEATPRPYSVWEFSELGASFALSHFEKSPVGWDPLPLEPDDVRAQELIKATKELADGVRSNNELAVSDPGLRDRLYSTLVAGFEFLERKTISRGQLKQLLLEPASWIMEVYPKALIAATARIVVEAVWNLLK